MHKTESLETKIVEVSISKALTRYCSGVTAPAAAKNAGVRFLSLVSNKRNKYFSAESGMENILKNKPHSFEMTKGFRVTNVCYTQREKERGRHRGAETQTHQHAAREKSH